VSGRILLDTNIVIALLAQSPVAKGQIPNHKPHKVIYTNHKKGRKKMARTIKARFSNGVIEPLEKVEIPEGEEITVTIEETSERKRFLEALKSTAGGWKDLIDAEELKKNIYNDRLISARPEVKL
jgi:predicted DNA-binding antitoxin AbrB/MazE fold protein